MRRAADVSAAEEAVAPTRPAGANPASSKHGISPRKHHSRTMNSAVSTVQMSGARRIQGAAATAAREQKPEPSAGGVADLPALDSIVEELCGNESLLSAIQEVIVRKLRKRPHLDSASKRKLIDKTVIEIFHKIDIGEMLLNELNNTAELRACGAPMDPVMPRPAYSEEEPRPSEVGAARRRGRRRGQSRSSDGPSSGAVSGGSSSGPGSSQQYRAPECLAPSVHRRLKADSQHRDQLPKPTSPYRGGDDSEAPGGGDLAHRRGLDFGATQVVDLRAISESMEECDDEDGQHQGPELLLGAESPRSSEAETEPLGAAEELDRQRLRQQQRRGEEGEDQDESEVIGEESERHHREALGQEHSRNMAQEDRCMPDAYLSKESSDADEVAVIQNTPYGENRVGNARQYDVSKADDVRPPSGRPALSERERLGEEEEAGYDSLYRDETWEEMEPEEELGDGKRRRRVVFHENVVSDVFLSRYKFDRSEVADLFFTVEEGYQFQVDFDRELDRAKEANKGWLEWIMERTEEEAARHEAEDRWPGGGSGREAEHEGYEVEAIDEDEFF